MDTNTEKNLFEFLETLRDLEELTFPKIMEVIQKINQGTVNAMQVNLSFSVLSQIFSCYQTCLLKLSLLNYQYLFHHKYVKCRDYDAVLLML